MSQAAMARSAGAFVVAAVMIASGCMGSSSSTPSPSTNAAKPKESPSQTVLVPKLRNQWTGAVVPRLHRAGLRIAISTPWSMTSFDGPLAFGVAPGPGTRVPAGSVVTLRVGRILGSPGQSLGRHVVPNVGHDRLDQATKQIEAAKLPWSVHATALPPTATANLFSAYCVTSQNPSSGTVITVARSNHQIREVELQAKRC